MKQTYVILGIVGAFLLLMGAVGAYAYSNTDTARSGMMGTYGMMNGNYRNMMGNNGNYAGMMGNIDPQTRDQMNALHDQMIKNLDPQTAKQMDAMHDTCMGNTDDSAERA